MLSIGRIRLRLVNDILKIAYKKRSLNSCSNFGSWFSGDGSNMVLTTNGIKTNDNDNDEKYASIYIYCTHKTDIYDTFFNSDIMKEKRVKYISNFFI